MTSPRGFDLPTADDEAFAPHHGYICTAACLYYYYLHIRILINRRVKIRKASFIDNIIAEYTRISFKA